MLKKRNLILLFWFMLILMCLAGCNRYSKKVTESEDKKVEIKLGNIDGIQKNIRNMDEWNGSWVSFSEYCRDKELDYSWNQISDFFDLKQNKIKDIFENLCFITDDVVKLDITDGLVTAYDSKNKKVFSHYYQLIGVFDGNSNRTVITGQKSYLFETENKDAGNFKYLCIMPICSMEGNQNGLKLAEHFHFNYGFTIEKATNRSGIPTMIENDITSIEKQQTLLGFFLGSKMKD